MGDLFGETSRDEMIAQIVEGHYTKSIPSGKSHFFDFEEAVVVFSIPANQHVGSWLLGYEPNTVWELSRLHAPDGHEKNLLTRAIKSAISRLQKIEHGIDALVSYADQNVGHHGGIYRAASWTYLGEVEESRYYRDPSGTVISRRSFHSGSRGMTKAEIEALGYVEIKMPGRHRFAKGLTRKARAAIARKQQFWSGTGKERVDRGLWEAAQ